jgi:hypothetical protein
MREATGVRLTTIRATAATELQQSCNRAAAALLQLLPAGVRLTNIRVLILLYMCPHTKTCVLILLYVSSY